MSKQTKLAPGELSRAQSPSAEPEWALDEPRSSRYLGAEVAERLNRLVAVS